MVVCIVYFSKTIAYIMAHSCACKYVLAYVFNANICKIHAHTYVKNIHYTWGLGPQGFLEMLEPTQIYHHYRLCFTTRHKPIFISTSLMHLTDTFIATSQFIQGSCSGLISMCPLALALQNNTTLSWENQQNDNKWHNWHSAAKVTHY